MKPRISIVHPRLGWGHGGSEARALWAIDALKRDYRISVITTGPFDLHRLNDYYGTRLDRGDFFLKMVPLPPGLGRTRKFAALRSAWVARFCRRVAPRFDLMISTYSPIEFGIQGIQCIADFSFVPEWRTALHPALRDHKSWWYGDSFLRRTYLGFCRWVSGEKLEGWKKDLILANSDWSARLMGDYYGIQAPTLYPPVTDDFLPCSYEERESGFVCAGRMVPEKRVHTIIEILHRVRRRGNDVHLHIIGERDGSGYVRTLEKMALKNPEWLFLEGRLSGQEKKTLMARHRFGLNACENEAFGIAVAEMVKAGCIVFVPNGGGQVEIVDHPDLIYQNVDDAVQKIEAVLENSARQTALREHLARQGERFSIERFQAGIRAAVAEFLRESKRE